MINSAKQASPSIAVLLADVHGTVVTKEPGASTWSKFSVWFLGLLPIESQL
jgi:hypothetical protein